jgi:hypothetical protein
MQQIGNALMLRFALPLEIIGLLLTVALIGAVIIVMREGDAMTPLASASPFCSSSHRLAGARWTQRHSCAHWNRIDAERRKTQLHRILALWPEP